VDELAMLLLRMSSSLTALSRIFLEFESTMRHFHCRKSVSYSCWKRAWWVETYVTSGDALDMIEDHYKCA
jgi:hypothetical protein